jgi:hypothetical protein
MEKPIKIIVAVLIVGIVLFLGYSMVAKWHRTRVQVALMESEAACAAQLEQLQHRIETLEAELGRMSATPIPENRFSEIFGDKAEYLSYDTKVDCKALEAQIMTFFKYLDNQPYMAAYKEKNGGARQLYRESMTALTASPPMLTGELEDLISLIRNVTHLYRSLGKERIDMIKKIIENEGDIIESVLAIFYLYALPEGRCQNKKLPVPTLEAAYNYSGYFLNTLAGRSCLLRRDSKVRVLLSYYAVLVLDRSIDETLNSSGIDIRPFIDVSYYEISSQRSLVYQKQYVTELERLREKYEM